MTGLPKCGENEKSHILKVRKSQFNCVIEHMVERLLHMVERLWHIGRVTLDNMGR